MLARSTRLLRAPQLALRTATRAYHERIVDHYESPRNVGSLDKSDPSVGTGLVGAPACGDVMKLQMRLGPDGKVEEAVFKVAPTPETAQLSPGPRCAQSPFTCSLGCGARLSRRRRLDAARRLRALRTPPSG